MKGFKAFIMRGNLVELAVAFIVGGAFATVVTAFTKLVLGLIGKATGGIPNFDTYLPAGLPVGPFLTALLSFLVLAAVVYFGVVLPYERVKSRFVKPAEPADPTELQLLIQIRDLLAARRSG